MKPKKQKEKRYLLRIFFNVEEKDPYQSGPMAIAYRKSKCLEELCRTRVEAKELAAGLLDDSVHLVTIYDKVTDDSYHLYGKETGVNKLTSK